MGHSIPGATINIEVLLWSPMVNSKGSVASMADSLPATDPSSWQKAIGLFNLFRWIPSFPTRVGLTRHLVHSESNGAVNFTLFPKLSINCRGKVTGSIGPLTKGSFSRLLSDSLEFSLDGIGVLTLGFGMGGTLRPCHFSALCPCLLAWFF